MADTSGDPNMAFALSLAIGFGVSSDLPAELESVEARARFVDRIDGPFLGGNTHYEMAAFLGQRLRDISETCRNHVASVTGELDRLSVALRLWSGCISAAKTIALETRSGPNSPDIRREAFERFIDPAAASDPVYRAGVEAAPAFKALRNQEVAYEGVPSESVVRHFGGRHGKP